MSSPPTPTTSVKAAPLHFPARKHQRRSPFPSVAILNPFRKKVSAKTAKSPSPIEPYEVAPGIWNTDATAKVFGYLEPAQGKKGRSRSKSAGSGIRHYSQSPKRKPGAPRGSPDSTKKGRDDAGTDRINHLSPKTYVELPGQSNEIRTKEARTAVVPNQTPADSERMRTVGRDDQLVQRGANPRTGLVSPFVVSDSSDDNLGHDYVHVPKVQWNDRPSPKARTRSGKWKQRGVGWSLVESPSLSPIAQSIHSPLSRKVSVKQLEDKLLVEMPGVDNPEPENMTDEQIRKYQESIARAYKHGGITAMVDPDTLPSPRLSSPDGPSTPPNKLHRIRRKMVGSGPSRKEESNDTIVINDQQRTSSLPTPRKEGLGPPWFPNVGPRSTIKGSVLGTQLDNKTVATEGPFLGHPTSQQCGRIRSISHSPSLQFPRQQAAHSGLPGDPESPSRVDLVNPTASPTLSQYLPRLDFLHPSHFANLGTSSYRRPVQMLPERLRPLEQRRQTIEDACTTTITSTSNRKQENEQRPKVRRQEGSIVVPRVRPHSPQKYEMSKENYLQDGIPRKKPSSVIKHMVDASESRTTRGDAMQHPGQIAPAREMARTRHQLGISPQHPQQDHQAFSQGAKQGARVAMIEDYRNHQSHHIQSRQRFGGLSLTRTSRLESANIGRDPVPRGPKSGVGITHTCGHLGKDWRKSGGTIQRREQSVGAAKGLSQEPGAPTEFAGNRNGGVGFAGQWAESLQNHRGLDSAIPKSTEERARKRSVFGIAADVRLRWCMMERSLRASAKLKYIQQRLCQMTGHIIRTLHPTSPVLHILKTPNVRAQDYLGAAKEVLLATFYLLLLLNVMLALRRVMMSVGLVVFWMWHPLKMVFAIIRWCVLG